METKNLINLQELDGKALEVCIKQINKHFNINFLKAENGEAVAELELEERHKNLFNIPYGGVLFNLADCTTGMAFISLGRPGVTVSASVNFMRGLNLTVENTISMPHADSNAGQNLSDMLQQEAQKGMADLSASTTQSDGDVLKQGNQLPENAAFDVVHILITKKPLS